MNSISSCGSVRLISASLSARRLRSATCEVKVFEAATPTSIPQRVKSVASTSRVICVPMRFVIASVRAPLSRASLAALTVSRVSPDCEIPITSVSLERTGLR